MLYVKNTNSFAFKSRYDGVDFYFPVNDRTAISREAAAHIFGFGNDNKFETLIKHGWCRSSDAVEEGMRILNRFVFSEDEPVPTDPVTEGIPSFSDRNKKLKKESATVTE